MEIVDGRNYEWVNLEELCHGDVFEGTDGNIYIFGEYNYAVDLKTGELKDIDWDVGNSYLRIEDLPDGGIKLLVRKVNAKLVVK